MGFPRPSKVVFASIITTLITAAIAQGNHCPTLPTGKPRRGIDKHKRGSYSNDSITASPPIAWYPNLNENYSDSPQCNDPSASATAQSCSYVAFVVIEYWIPSVTLNVATVVINITEYPDTTITNVETQTVPANITSVWKNSLSYELYPTANGKDPGIWVPEAGNSYVELHDESTVIHTYNGQPFTLTAPTPMAQIISLYLEDSYTCDNDYSSTGNCRLDPSKAWLFPLHTDLAYTEMVGEVQKLSIPGLSETLAKEYPEYAGCTGLGNGFPAPKAVVTALTTTVVNTISPTSSVTVSPTSSPTFSPGQSINKPSGPGPYNTTSFKLGTPVELPAHLESSARSEKGPSSIGTPSVTETVHTEHEETDINTPSITTPHSESGKTEVTTRSLDRTPHREESDTAIKTPEMPQQTSTTSRSEDAGVTGTAELNTVHIEKSTSGLIDPTSNEIIDVPATAQPISSDPTVSNPIPTEEEGPENTHTGEIGSAIICGFGADCGPPMTSQIHSTDVKPPPGTPQTVTADFSNTRIAITYPPGASIVVIGSDTLSADGPAITISSQYVSLGPQGLIWATTSAVQLAGPSNILPPNAVATFTLGSNTKYTYSSGATALVIGGSTLSIGGPEAIISGQIISLGSQGVVVHTPTPTVEAVFTIGSKKYTYFPASTSTLVIGSQTLSAGGSAITIDGSVISLATNGVIYGNSTISFSTVSVQRQTKNETVSKATITSKQSTNNTPFSTLIPPVTRVSSVTTTATASTAGASNFNVAIVSLWYILGACSFQYLF